MRTGKAGTDPLDLPGKLSPHSGEIGKLVREARFHSADAKASATLAIEAAYKAGTLLLAEKSWLEARLREDRDALDGDRSHARTIPRGASWSVWFDAIIAGGSNGSSPTGKGSGPSERLTPGEAERYMRLAARHEGQKAFDFDEPNLVRSGLLALEFFPPKHHDPLEGDRLIPRQGRHLIAVNTLVSWWRALIDRVPVSKLDVNIRGRLLADLAPIIEIVEELRRHPTPRKESFVQKEAV